MTNGGPEFVLRRMSDTSDVSLLREIRRVDALVNLPTLTRTEFQKHAKVHSSTISKRFGTWQGALECAGIAAKFEGRTLSEGSGVGRRNTDDEEILNELRQLAERLGRNVLTSDEIRSELGVTSRQVIWLFPEQLRLQFVPVLHGLQGCLAAQG